MNWLVLPIPDSICIRAVCILAARPTLSFRCFSLRSMRRLRRSAGVSSSRWKFSASTIFAPAGPGGAQPNGSSSYSREQVDAMIALSRLDG